MDRTLAQFIKILRGSDVRISIPEALDAVRALHLVGYRDRQILKASLGQVLAKTAREKAVYAECFERFFSFDSFSGLKKETDSPEESEKTYPPIPPSENQNPLIQSILGRMLLEGDHQGLAVSMAEAARSAGVSEIVLFTQTALFTRRILEYMGWIELEEEITNLEFSDAPEGKTLAAKLEEERDYLLEEVRAFVDQQLELYSVEPTRRIREKSLRRIDLSRAEHRDFQQMQLLVGKMARRLTALHSRRRKIHNRGKLDVRRTLRENLAYQGLLLKPRWKMKKRERPRIFAVCDVSGSVQTAARFLLMFLYSLNEILPKVRSFAFSSRLEEVTDYFEGAPVEEAIPRILSACGSGSTDYGQAFVDFRRLCYDRLDHRSTVIILGDGRSNYGNPRVEILRQIFERARQVIWLNPEPRALWSYGDSEMNRIAPHCHRVEACSTLVHLERIIGDILRTAA